MTQITPSLSDFGAREVEGVSQQLAKDGLRNPLDVRDCVDVLDYADELFDEGQVRIGLRRGGRVDHNIYDSLDYICLQGEVRSEVAMLLREFSLS